MTWADTTHTSTRSLGNFNRMIQAKDTLDAGRGVDFAEAVTVENAWSVTSLGPVAIRAPREEPV